MKKRATVRKPAQKYLITGIFILIGIVTAVLAGPAQTAKAAASSYQFPCSPYQIGGYNFAEWVSSVRAYHAGQDVSCRTGTPVYATAEGQVVYSARTPDSYRWGNLIMIQHVNPDGSQVTSVYGHLANNRQVAAGQQVGKGQLIGFIGPAFTGENGNWADHLHFAFHHGSYGAPIGSYANNIHGYESAAALGGYANPANYINSRQAPSEVWDYQMIGIAGTGSFPQSSDYVVEFRLRNTGNTTWRPDGPNPVRLGTNRPHDRVTGFSGGMLGHGWSAPNRIDVHGVVPPGQIGVFKARFNNRGVGPGRYFEHFAPLVEGRLWMPDRNLYAELEVQPPRHRAEYVGQGTFDGAASVDPSYLMPGQKINLKAYIKNTGDLPWLAGGANPLRLGTTRPLNRSSQLATQDPSLSEPERWLSSSRPSGLDGRYTPSNNTITPTDTINPGEIAAFSFTIAAPSQPGEYIEYFNPVLEGREWLNDLAMWYKLRVVPPGYHYEYVRQDNPQPIVFEKGQSEAAVYIRNSGQTTWPVGDAIRLGTDRARDRTSAFKADDWVNGSRPSGIDANATVPGKSTIAPGEVAKFDFDVKTVSAPDGAYNEYFNPVVEGVTWFPENYGIYVPATVSSPDNDYGYITQRYDQNPSALHYGDTVITKIAMRNIGKVAWPTTGPNAVKLGTSRGNDRTSSFYTTGADAWPSPTRASAIDGKVTNMTSLAAEPAAEIKQGEVALFSVPIKVRSVPPGTYNEYFNLVREGITWLPDYGIYIPLSVSGQEHDYQIKLQNFSADPSNVRQGDPLIQTLVVKNIGSATWPVLGPNAVKVGTIEPWDRPSNVAKLDGPDAWLSKTRASVIKGRVTNLDTLTTEPASEIAPGELALFRFALNTDVPPTTYRENFQLVHELIAWFSMPNLVTTMTVRAPMTQP